MHRHLDHSPPNYAFDIDGMTGDHHTKLLLVEIGSCKLFAQAGLELQSS
jgi:hypothetical protein